MLSAVNYRATIGTNITTVIGNNITFVCVAEGRPRPGVSWWKDNLELDVNETAHVVYASGTNATGVYSCVARNLAGSITTSSTVTVLGKWTHFSLREGHGNLYCSEFRGFAQGNDFCRYVACVFMTPCWGDIFQSTFARFWLEKKKTGKYPRACTKTRLVSPGKLLYS